MPCSVVVLLALLPVAAGWTRYNPSDGVFFENLTTAADTDVTPFASYPVQGEFYFWMSRTHSYVVVPIAILAATQWIRTKGDSLHVNLGTICKWLFVLMVIQGWVLQIRHSFLSESESFAEYPAIFELPMARPLVSFFGFSLTAACLHSFWVGVKDESRRIGLHSPAWYFLIFLNIMTFVCGVWYYIFAFNKLFTEPFNFKWEVNLEAAVVFSVLFIYDGTQLWAMAGWSKTGELRDWKEHHVMNITWVTSSAMAAILLFTMHDARHIWTFPGVENVWLRLGGQLGPQLVLFACQMPRIIGYLMVCGPNQEKRDVQLVNAETEVQ